MNQEQIYEKASAKTGLPVTLISNVYKEYWNFIRTSISQLPLTDTLSEKDFEYLKTSYNIPSLGKLYCSYSRYKTIQNKNKQKNQNNDKYKED